MCVPEVAKVHINQALLPLHLIWDVLRGEPFTADTVPPYLCRSWFFGLGVPADWLAVVERHHLPPPTSDYVRLRCLLTRTRTYLAMYVCILCTSLVTGWACTVHHVYALWYVRIEQLKPSEELRDWM